MPATPPSAFVGREAELARLTAALAEAGAGRAPAAVVQGESGAGKTRLLREFASVAAGTGATVLFGRCVDCGEAGPPYWPVLEALRPLPGAGSGGQPGDSGAGRAGRSGADAGGRAGAAGFFERVLDRLETAALRSPVVLILDDLHWADRSTRDLLGFLLANLAGGPGPLIVTAVRSEALGAGHPVLALLAELRRSRRADFLTLDRLGKVDVAAMLTTILGGPPGPDVLDEIWRRSEGNPFFVEELAAAARSGRSAAATLEPILAARLGGLSPGARAAAEAVAAAVGPVPHRVVADVAGLAEPALLAGLRECVDHHILVADGGAGTYAFRHSLLRDAAYAALLPGEATRLHAAYGRVLSAALSPPAAGPGPAGELAAVAWHLYAAGDAEAALPATLAAALAAEAAGGYAEAHVQYERALELAGRLPAGALESAFLRAAGPPAGTPVEAPAPVGPEPAFLTAAGPPSGTPVGEPSAGGGPFDWVALAERAAEAAHLGGDPARAVVLLRMSLAATGPGREGAGADRAAGLQLGLGRALWAAGDSDGALRAYDEALRRLPDPETAVAVRAAAAAAEARMLAGRYGDSRRLAEETLIRARRLGLPLEEAGLLGTLGVDLALLGDADPAVAALDDAVAAAEQAGGPRPLARALLNRVEVLSGPLNRLAEAADVAAAGLPRLRRLGLGRSYAAALAAALANTLFRLGRWDDADPVIAAALAERPTGAAAVELLLARARLAVGRGDFAAAEADLEQVDRRFTQAVAPRYRAPRLTLAAGLALWEGRIPDAREAVAQALDIVEGSDDVWLVAPVLWHGLRAEGDFAEQARAVGDPAGAEAGARAATALVARAAALHQHAAPAVRPVVAAYETLCRGEETRAAGDPDPDVWAAAARRWASLDQPYPAAYARFREAEAALAGRARSARAADALRAAHEVAARLGAEPFRRDVEALARRARMELSPPAAAAAEGGLTERGPVGRRSAGPDDATPSTPLDTLTPRELDVLSLLADGRTNKEVAAALFISQKTAGVHVSHILAKLGVRSRVQAVAIAHRADAAGRR